LAKFTKNPKHTIEIKEKETLEAQLSYSMTGCTASSYAEPVKALKAVEDT